MVGKVGNADLCSCFTFTDYYSVIFIDFVNTGLAVSFESLDCLKKGRLLKCFCHEEFLFGSFVNFSCLFYYTLLVYFLSRYINR